MQAAILAGGLGTRLKPLTGTVPKAMVPVNGRPFLEYEIELLKKSGVRDIVLCVGHFGEKIREHFREGKAFGVRIRYSSDGKKLLGPIGGLKMAEEFLDDAFFVTYGDAYLRIGYRTMMETLIESQALGLMAVYRNNGKYGKSDVVVRDGQVVEYDKKAGKPEMVWINFGVSALRKTALKGVKEGEFLDEESFYKSLIRKRQLLSFEVDERFYEIGSPTGLDEFSKFVKMMEILQWPRLKWPQQIIIGGLGIS
jgi:NDP-sugar pyrophosphorylase family protein